MAAKNLLRNAPHGQFKVSVFDSRDGIGGLWPVSRTDSGRQVHPLMVANQSKHTMQFSDMTWEHDTPQLPRAWMVGRYLERYMDRYLSSHPGFSLHLNTKVVQADPKMGGREGWDVRLESHGKEVTEHFEYLVVASGYFGKPVVPDGLSIARSASVPIIHTSEYRNLKTLLSNKTSAKGKILVAGGQISGVETAGTIATHLSSAMNSPESFPVSDIDQCSVHHVIHRPVWVFPLYTTAEVSTGSLQIQTTMMFNFDCMLTNMTSPKLQLHRFCPLICRLKTVITGHCL